MDLDLLRAAREQLWDHLKVNPDDDDSLAAYEKLGELTRNPVKDDDVKYVEAYKDSEDDQKEDEKDEKEEKELCEFCKRKNDYMPTYRRREF